MSDKSSDYTTKTRFLMYTNDAQKCFWCTRGERHGNHTQISPIFNDEHEAVAWLKDFDAKVKQTNNVVPFNSKVRGLFE